MRTRAHDPLQNIFKRCSSIDQQINDIIQTYITEHRLSQAQVERGQRAAEVNGERLDIVLNKLGLLSDDDLLGSYIRVSGLPRVAIEALRLVDLTGSGIDPAFLRTARIFPYQIDDMGILCAIADPFDSQTITALRFRTGLPISLFLATAREIEAAYANADALQSANLKELSDVSSDVIADDIDRLKDIASEAPIIRLVSDLIEAAVQQSASDIHITRTAEEGRVRFRKDGHLQDVQRLPPLVHQAVVSRLKIMAALDIGERRLPQDGRIRVPVLGREIDLRLSTMPHIHGEGIFIRVLDNKAATLDLDRLGLSARHTSRIKGILNHAHGLFLVTGPTGSGKTTTLYAALRHLNDPTKNIVTVEDPIEYSLPGINQIQVNRRAGLDFARTLRSVLRQDPDIIMVGEIRDRETAAIAIQAALTGHLVLATLHTNDALSAIDRLVDMEVERFLLSSVLRGVMAQRLVRRLCDACNGSDLHCPKCNDSGYGGRIPLVEVVSISLELQQAITHGESGKDLSKLAASSGFEPLEMDGRRLIQEGKTSNVEILRALGG